MRCVSPLSLLREPLLNTYKIAELCDHFTGKKMKKRKNGFKTTKIY